MRVTYMRPNSRVEQPTALIEQNGRARGLVRSNELLNAGEIARANPFTVKSCL